MNPTPFQGAGLLMALLAWEEVGLRLVSSDLELG